MKYLLAIIFFFKSISQIVPKSTHFALSLEKSFGFFPHCFQLMRRFLGEILLFKFFLGNATKQKP